MFNGNEFKVWKPKKKKKIPVFSSVRRLEKSIRGKPKGARAVVYNNCISEG